MPRIDAIVEIWNQVEGLETHYRTLAESAQALNNPITAPSLFKIAYLLKEARKAWNDLEDYLELPIEERVKTTPELEQLKK